VFFYAIQNFNVYDQCLVYLFVPYGLHESMYACFYGPKCVESLPMLFVFYLHILYFFLSFKMFFAKYSGIPASASTCIVAMVSLFLHFLVFTPCLCQFLCF
jgi:hypothetical protein